MTPVTRAPAALTPVVLPLGRRSAAVLAVASLAGLVMFAWPLLIRTAASERVEPPFVFALLLPLVVVMVLADLADGGIDSRALAILGVLTAVNAVLRGLSAGVAGIELVFFLLILGGRVFGPGFGFVLGCTSLFASALLTGGVGPWLPYQMLASAWEIWLLVGYAVLAAYAFGLVMNLTGWPFLAGIAVPGHDGSVSFVPGDPLTENLRRFGIYTLLTSTGGWDTGRALTTGIAIAALGPAILTTLRRAARRATVTPAEPTVKPSRRTS
jgi:energy-coupling factor transport system substrate-specific component